MFPSKEEMRAQYWELEDKREALLKKSAPLRVEREALREKMAPIQKADKLLRDSIIKIERPLLPQIDQERAMIQKALSGKVGKRGGETVTLTKDDIGVLKV